MEIREFIAANAAEFSASLRAWLAIPSVSADPARHADVRRPNGLVATVTAGPGERPCRSPIDSPAAAVAVGLDADRIHAPNEYVDLSRLLKGAETAAYRWQELAVAGAGQR